MENKLRERVCKNDKLKLEKSEMKTILHKLKKVFYSAENILGLTMVFNRTKYRKIEKAFFKKHFELKQS